MSYTFVQRETRNGVPCVILIEAAYDVLVTEHGRLIDAVRETMGAILTLQAALPTTVGTAGSAEVRYARAILAKVDSGKKDS